MTDYIKYPLILFIVTVVCTFLVSCVYTITTPILAQKNEQTINDSLKVMYPDMKEFKKVEANFDSEDIVSLFRVNNSEDIYYVYEAAKQGKNADIKMLISLDDTGEVDNISYTRMQETNGIGTQVTEQSYVDSILNLSPENRKLDTISGATISSTAVSTMVEQVISEYESNGGDYE